MNKYDFSLNMENAEYSNDSHAMILDQIQKYSTVLEFGPASGIMTQYLREKLNCDVYIVEVDQCAYESAMRFAKDGVCTMIEDLAWVEKFISTEFDYILFADVLEHISDGECVLQAAKKLLKYDGKVILSVPNIAHSGVLAKLYLNNFDYQDIGLLDRTHVHFYSYNSLLQLMEQVGLHPIRLDATYLPMDTAEFREDTVQLPGDILKMLEKRTFGHVYQFLFTAVKDIYWERENLSVDNRLKEYTGCKNASNENVYPENVYKKVASLEMKVTDYDLNLKKALERTAELEDTVADYDINLRKTLEQISALKGQVTNYDFNLRTALERIAKLEDTVADYDFNLKRALERTVELENTVTNYDINLRKALERAAALEAQIADYDLNLKRALERTAELESTVADYDFNLREALKRTSELDGKILIYDNNLKTLNEQI